nr:neuropeptide-like protein 31 [Rhipicephalus microplus]
MIAVSSQSFLLALLVLAVVCSMAAAQYGFGRGGFGRGYGGYGGIGRGFGGGIGRGFGEYGRGPTTTKIAVSSKSFLLALLVLAVVCSMAAAQYGFGRGGFGRGYGGYGGGIGRGFGGGIGRGFGGYGRGVGGLGRGFLS